MTNTCPQLPPGMADASWQKHFELLWGSDYIILRINNSFEPSRSGLSWQIPKPPWSWVNLEGGWLIFNQALNQLFDRDKKKSIYEYLYRLTETCRQKSSCFLKSPIPTPSLSQHYCGRHFWKYRVLAKNSDFKVSTRMNSSPSSPVWGRGGLSYSSWLSFLILIFLWKVFCCVLITKITPTNAHIHIRVFVYFV